MMSVINDHDAFRAGVMPAGLAFARLDAGSLAAAADLAARLAAGRIALDLGQLDVPRHGGDGTKRSFRTPPQSSLIISGSSYRLRSTANYEAPRRCLGQRRFDFI